ncbi:MAG: hypothetical protein ABT00_01530 [Bordetella sp. SCN 68-11]|nr:MAG: hypothetical protein ABT00_01530 [Bordetella sp. SCN 68-11]
MNGTAGIAIIGAGMTGLTAALTLARQGVGDVRVYDAAQALEEVGAGIAIGGNAVRVLREVGIDASTFGHVPPALEFRSWDRGRIVAVNEVGPRYTASIGAPYLTFHRATLQRALVEEIGRAGVKVELGHRLESIEVGDAASPATLTFEGGRSVRAAVVIAADGIHSAARRSVVPELRPRYSGELAFRGVVPLDRVPDYPCAENLSIWCGPATHAVNYAVDDGALINLFAVMRPDRLPEWTTRTNRMRGERAQAVEDFRSRGWDRRIVDLVSGSDGDLHYWALMDLPPAPRWHRGRVVLAGDAVHGPLPHQGMGGGMGVESGYAIGALLARHGIAGHATAFDDFVALRRPRVRRVQAWSRLAGALYKLVDAERIARRDRTLWQAADAIRWMHGDDVVAAVRGFERGAESAPGDAVERVVQALGRTAGLAASELRQDTRLADVGVDSLATMELLLELDADLDVPANVDLSALKTIGDVARCAPLRPQPAP